MTLLEAHATGKKYRRKYPTFGGEYGRVMPNKQSKFVEFFYGITGSMPLTYSNVFATDWEVEPDLVLELGKLYRTRNGRKAFVYEIGIRDNYPVQAIIVGYGFETFTYDGIARRFDEQHPLDIVSEWKEGEE